MPRCHISLGGNSGRVAEAFDAALDRLRNTPLCSVAAVSHYFETAAVGDHAGGSFLNAAAALEISLNPFELLDVLQAIERDLGRIRTLRWGPRTIDLDLLYYGSETIDSPRLVVPHPAAWFRRFVLDPLVEIAPSLVHPVKQATIQTLRDRLLVRPLPVAFAGGDAGEKKKLMAELTTALTAVSTSDWDLQPAGTDEPALIFWMGAGGSPHAQPDATFDRLPSLARIDVTAAAEKPHECVRHVLQAALG